MLFTYFEIWEFYHHGMEILPRRHGEHEVKISNPKI